MKKILIADDNKQITLILSSYAKKEGLEPIVALDGKEALEKFAQHSGELAMVLLDVMMPEVDGFEVCRRLRQQSMVPIIMITARGEDYDKIMGLDIGADDYVIKPFSAPEVMARVRAVLRRTATESGEEEAHLITYQGIVMNLDKKTVAIDGEEIAFTKTEFELLHLLLDERGRVFSRQELIDRVWPKDVLVLDRTVDVNITRLRKKIGRFAKCIVTRLGFGYYFDA